MFWEKYFKHEIKFFPQMRILFNFRMVDLI